MREELTDLILQRTRPFIALGGKPALAEWTETGRRDHLADFLIDRGLTDDYRHAALEEIRSDCSEYISMIGDSPARRIVSVGVGNGYAEAMLMAHYRPEAMLLIDTETGGRGHGFSAKAAGYASLTRAADRVRKAYPNTEVETWNPEKQAEPVFRFDMLISMYAMGFHFPVDSYAGFIRRNASPGSLLAYDARDANGSAVRILRGSLV